jgi:predicted CXXCH cytochrome family protein
MRATGPKIVTLVLSLICFLVPSVLAGGSSGVHGISGSDCLSCHQDQLAGSVGHYINHNDDCILCHEVLTANSTMTTLKSDNTCQVCHVDVASPSSGEFHTSTACVDCHDAHSSNNSHLFRQPETELCQGSCHGDHDIGVSHPVGETVADSRSGGAMSCVSTCHSMHEPAEPKMLQMAALDLCYQCHDDKF